MNILFFAHEAQLYGANRSLLNLLGELRKRNVNCFVLLPQTGPMCEELSHLNIGFEVVKFHWWVSSPKVSFWKTPKKYINRRKASLAKVKATLRELPKIRHIASRFGADIVYSNSSVIWVGFLISKLLRRPHVWHIREFKDIDHNLHLDFGNQVFKISLLLSNRVFFISNAVKEYVFPAMRSDKFKIIYNGVGSVEEFEKHRFENNYGAAKFCFLIIGAISKNKGQEEAVEAFYQVRQRETHLKLIIAGKGNQDELKDLLTKLHIEDHVFFTGHLEEPHHAYKQANVVLMCSKSEGFGRVTAEAMMHSLPVIGYDNGGTSEIIIDSYTGYLYNSTEMLVEKMRALAANPSLCKSLGENGWNHAVKKYTSEAYAGTIYEQLKLLGISKKSA